MLSSDELSGFNRQPLRWDFSAGLRMQVDGSNSSRRAAWKNSCHPSLKFMGWGWDVGMPPRLGQHRTVLPEHEGASVGLHGEGRGGWGGSRGCAAPQGCPMPRQLLLVQAVNDPGVSWQE